MNPDESVIMKDTPVKKSTRIKKISPFAKNLEKLLKEKNLTLREAGKLADVPVATVASWLSGATPGDFMKVSQLAQKLKVDFEFLLTGQSSGAKISEIPLDDFFEEEKQPSMEGLYKVRFVRLIRKPRVL